ncbi:MAG: hypothetical protein QOG33_2405 [Gaiellales bacterium]|nr:hypothetical protein [Gaiellales bacterium]
MHRLLDWLFGWLSALVPVLGPGGGIVVGLVEIALVLGLVAAVVWVLVRVVGRFRGRSSPARSPQLPSREARFAEARAGAIRLASSDPREAIRLLYSALLRELGHRRGWRPPPGRSNWSFVRRLGVRSDQGEALAEATRLFESRIYGSLQSAEGDVRRVDELVDVVLS